MENLQPLATESFSYRWLFNGRPSLDALQDSESPRTSADKVNAIELTTFIVFSKRFLKDGAQSFDFDLPAGDSEPAPCMVHADEIFADGQITPLFIKTPKTEPIEEPSSGSMVTPPAVVSQAKNDQDSFEGKWRELPIRILQKWLRYLKPLFKRLRISRKTNKVDDLKSRASAPRFTKAYSASDRAGEERRGNKKKNLRKIRSWSSTTTPQASPLQSPFRSTVGDHKQDMECLVNEAILHCKRSFGMIDSVSS